MKPGLKVGDTSSHSFTVGEQQLVPALFGGDAFPEMPAVLATGQMVALMEWACVEMLRPFYADGEDSLGIHVDVDHTAPTLPGQQVRVDVELEEIDGRFLWFRVTAHDEIDRIGGGRHRRAVIERTRFEDRMAAKRRAIAGG